MPKVSVIVPVYNTAEYLKDCFDSILAQTFCDYEVIVIDDGSTDNSPAICDEYATIDSRIKVLHKTNEGVSAARNSGLNIATGKYITFIDSDDTVLPSMLEDLIHLAIDKNADIVQSAGPIKEGVVETGTVTYLTRDQVLDENFGFTDFYKPSLWLGIYKSSLFADIRFPNNIHFYEDFTVLTLLAAKSNGVVFIDRRYYNYIQREGSANHSGLSQKKKSAINIPLYLERQEMYRTEVDRRNTYSFFIVGRFISTMTSCNATEEDFNFIKHMIKSNYLEILLARAPKFTLRALCLLYVIMPSIVKRIVQNRLGIK